MKIAVIFAVAWVLMIAAVLVSIHRWKKHLNRDAIPGLDQPPCENGAHGQEYTDTH